MGKGGRRPALRVTEEALRESEAILRSFYENSPVMMGVVEIVRDEIRHVYDNPATGRFLEGSPDVTHGRAASELGVPRRIEEVWLRHYRQCLLTGRPSHFEYLHEPAGKWLSVTVAAVPSASGHPRCCYVAEDVTERRRLAELERARDGYFRLLIEHATDLVSILDETRNVKYVSPALSRILGYGPEEVVGHDAFALVHREDVAHLETEFGRALREPEYTALVRYRCRARDGSWRVLESTARNLLSDPTVGGLVVNTRDLTEKAATEAALWRSEEQLRQAQRMESVGRLAGGIAHDFNNILTALGGTANLLLKDLGADSPAAPELTEILRGVDRAASLTRQLLAFSRRQLVQPRHVRVGQVVADTQKMLARLIGEDVELRLELQADLPVVLADVGQIEQVLMNLAVNARDAMPGGGILTLQTCLVDLAAPLPCAFGDVPPGRYVRLRVSDTGHGIPSETLPFIFEPFFTTKDAGSGTGLGLSTVYGIVQQAQGYLCVTTRLGVGTCFEIYLRPAEGEPVLAPCVQGAPAGGTETILVVEDEPVVRSLIRKILVRDGYTVLAAADGAEALRLAAEAPERIHLLLTDVVMPGLGGRQVAERLTESRPGLRVLFMSGYTQDAVLQHGVRELDMELLQKPFSPEELSGRIRAILDR